MTHRSRFGFYVLGLLLVLMQSSCAKMAYVQQAAAGQYDLGVRAKDIDELLQEERVAGRTRRLLAEVAHVKQFGERHGLKPTKNYRKYVHLDREYVVWVTSASEPLRFHSKSWSFPIVGSFTYLGWFSKASAEHFADGLRAKGWDVDVRGSTAYSTTGYFEDSVLSTMLRRDDSALGEMTDTILHEMTHATFFARRQSTLNESIANFVGNHLAVLYLEETLGPEAKETRAYEATERRAHLRGQALAEAYRTLSALYASPKSDQEKLAEKQALLTGLRAATAFRRPINNATLIQYKTYNSGQEELASLLATCDGSFPRFIRVLKTLEHSDWPVEQEKEVGRMILPLVQSNACRAVQ